MHLTFLGTHKQVCKVDSWMEPTFCAFTASSALSVGRSATNQQTSKPKGGDTYLRLYNYSCLDPDRIALVRQKSVSL
jgi:hypothetical protein